MFERGHGSKERLVKYWAILGCWILPCYGPFSLDARLETYEPFISLIFQIFFQAAVNRGYLVSDYGDTTLLVRSASELKGLL
jgi:hypothetical protein